SKLRRLHMSIQVLFSLCLRGSPAFTVSFAGKNPPDGPDGANAFSFLPPAMPPQYCGSWSSSPSVMPIGTSYTPGRFTSPQTEKNRRPFQPLVPRSAYVCPPLIQMYGAQPKVSTLLTSV